MTRKAKAEKMATLEFARESPIVYVQCPQVRFKLFILPKVLKSVAADRVESECWI